MAAIVTLVAATVAEELANYALDMALEQISGTEISETEKQLAVLKQGQQEIMRRLDLIRTDIQFSDIKHELMPHFKNIAHHFEKLCEFNKGDKEGIRKWANRVLHDSKGVEDDMLAIKRVIAGESDLNYSPMQVYIERLKLDIRPIQSSYYQSLSFFQSLLEIQIRALIVYTNAYRFHTHDRFSDLTAIMERLERYYNDQIQYNKPLVNAQNLWYHDTNWEGGYFELSTSPDDDHCHFVDLHPNCAPIDHVVVGIQFYKKGNRLGIKIQYADLDEGINDVKQLPANFQDSPGWGEIDGQDYFKLSDIRRYSQYTGSTQAGPYTGYNPMSPAIKGGELNLKDREVVTGVKFVRMPKEKGSSLDGAYQLSIQVQIVKLNKTCTSFESKDRSWRELNTELNVPLDLDTSGGYVHTAFVSPSPLSFINGVRLYKYGNRLAIGIKTSFDTI